MFRIWDAFQKIEVKPYHFYRWRASLRDLKNGMCPTITANMGTGGNNVPIIQTENGIRKLTPQECLKMQGFPEDFKQVVSNCQLYKQAGNSVSVPVVKRIADKIMGSLG